MCAKLKYKLKMGNEMLLEILAIGGLAFGVSGYFMAKKNNSSFSQGEALVIARMKQEAEQALHDFSVGKEDVLSAYEMLKARLASLNSVSAKLPAVAAVPVLPVVSAPVLVVPNVPEASYVAAPIVPPQV